MKKRTLLLSSLGIVLAAGGLTWWYAAEVAAHTDVISCFCAYGREDAAHVAADSRALVAGTVGEVWTYRRPGGGGRAEERVVRARLSVDTRFVHRDPLRGRFAPGSTVEVEQVAGEHEEFWATLEPGGRYAVSLSPLRFTGESSYDAVAVEELRGRAPGDARWRRAVAEAEGLENPCTRQDREFRENYGADDVVREWFA
ncbi:hypothetical protein ABT117_37105 [Streptomyces sp. NPDC002262]|uniref:hypothetical protein n=1 Tax=unclassified Streptomyces TaxID=2593676 RepID=UPI00331FDE05